MSRNEKVALEILNEIDRARSGTVSLDELEHNVWRLLEAADHDFPKTLAGRLEGFVQELRELERENLRFSGGGDPDPTRGADVVYNEVTGELGRFLG